MTISRKILLLVVSGAAWPIIAAEPLEAAPEFISKVPLRIVSGQQFASPVQLEATPLPDVPLVRVQPIVTARSLPDAQRAVIHAPEAWRNWASLASVRYKAGDYEQAFAAVRQMRVAAAARSEPLPLAADELYQKCRRAKEALTLLE